MAKTRAEIQKAYRERKKKKEGESYLAKERARRMSYYVPSSSLAVVDRKKRNKTSGERVRRHRQKKREMRLREADERRRREDGDDIGSIGESSGYESSSRTQGRNMIVRMNFNRRSGIRKRISRCLSKAHRDMKSMRIQYDNLHRKFKTLQRKCQRQKSNIQDSPRTPRSQTEKHIRDIGLSSTQRSQVRKHLLFSNALCREIKSSKEGVSGRRGEINVLKSIVYGRVLKKYRGLKWISTKTGISRFKRKAETGWQHRKQYTRQRTQRMFFKTVREFLERDDNSRAQPGKADTKKMDSGEKVQTRVLTDYLSNLHFKFTSENPSIKISLSSFCRMRPKHILLTRFISRSCCLCVRHENMALMLKTLRRENVTVSSNPEVYINETMISDDELRAQLPQTVVFGQWKRIQVTEKGKVKNVMRIVDQELDAARFLETLKLQTSEFKEHVYRVKKQYSEINKLKAGLPPHHILLQMDFAENYNCKSVDEIQSAYWNQTSVTLHPTVVYYKREDKLIHKSFVIVSDELAHSSSTVHACLDKLMPEIKLLDPEVEVVHYWTDGPTSQYRNRQVFFTVANHQEIYGTKAVWNYFEVGHGKGPCDGLGGTTKRMADEAVRSGKVVVQDAQDFYRWAVKSNLQGVGFLFVSANDCKSVNEKLSSRSVVALKGTFKLHAIVGLGHSMVAFRNVSCYCPDCLLQNLCNGWEKQSLQPKARNKTAAAQTCPIIDQERSLEFNAEGGIPSIPVDYDEGDYVATLYENNWYIGKIVQVDESDGEFEVSFLEKRKQFFQWPKREDVIWVQASDILCKIGQPIPTGKSERMMKIDYEEKKKLLEMFAERVAQKT